MSTVTPPVATPKASANVAPNVAPNASAAEQLIVERIEEARSALWWSELTRTTLMVVIGSMLALLVWLVMDHWIYSPGPTVRALCFVSLVVIAVWFFIRRAWPVMTSRVTREYAAWALEQDHPDYRQQLTSYVTLKDENAERGVRARVVRAIGARAASLLKSHDTLPGEATGTFRWWITAAGILAVLAAYCVASPKSSLASAKRLVAPLASIDPARRVQIRDVRPGDAETLAGRDLEVSAEVDGLASEESVLCRWSTDGPMRQSELKLDPSTDRFVGTLSLDPAASGLVRYTIEAGDAVAGPFHLGVENVPVVAIESVRYQPPEYTKRKIRTTSSPSITAIDGTKIRVTAKVNRPVKRAELQFNPKRLGEVVRPTGGGDPVEISKDGRTLVSDVMLRSARELENYRIRVWDSNDQANPDPIIYPIKVIADLPPEVAIVVPKKSPIQVPVGAQQIIEVHAMDADFELKRVTLRIDRGIDTLGNPDIWVKPENGSGKGNHVAEYRFRPLEHRLRVGDVVIVSATAIDNRNIPDDLTVGPNETTSDEIEIRIVDDEEDLPEDPTGNDGLSQPDEQPATDVEKSKQEESGQQNSGSQGSGGQSGGGQGSDSQPSEGENAGGAGSGGEGSGEQQTGEQQTGEQGESPQNSGGEKSDDQSTGQGGSQQSGDAQSAEQSGSDGDSPGSDNTSQSSDPQQSDQDPSGDQGAEGDQPDGETGGAGQQSSTDQSQGGESMGDPKGSGESTSNGADSKTNSGNTPDSGKQAAGGESGENAGNKSSGDPSAEQQGAVAQEQRGGEQSKAPPKHDGEAFERIKDYIEKQKQEQNQESPSAEKNEPAPKDDSAGSSESGESQTGESQTGESQTGESQTGESQTGESQTGESQTGESQTGESQTGESQTGESQTGESQTGESQTGESQTGESQTGESQTGESQTGESQTGESQTGESQTGESQTGESQTGESSGDKDSQSGEPSQSDSQAGEAVQDDQATGEKGEGEKGQPEQGKKSGEGERDGSESGDPSNQDSSQSSSSRGDGSGTETPPTSQDDGAETPPPPDLDYAKKATDMVLDYLDETRDQVDQDLLKDLDWSREDLKRFRDRWEKVREMDQPAQQATPANEFEDALRSLGLQQNQSPSESARDSADTLRNLRDSGNRRKAPAAIRDVFEAFRRRQ